MKRLTPLMACWNDETGILIKVPMMIMIDNENTLKVGLKIEGDSEDRKPLDDNDKLEVLKFLEDNKKDLQEIFKLPEEYTIEYY